MIKVKVLNMSRDHDIETLENIFTDIKITKSLRLIEYEKIYSQRDGAFHVLIIYEDRRKDHKGLTTPPITVAESPESYPNFNFNESRSLTDE